MNRKDFSHLLQKYLDDQCSLTERRIVESWFTLLDDGDQRWSRLQEADIQVIEQQLWNRLQQSIHNATNNSIPVLPVKKIFRLPTALRIAVSVIFLAIGVGIAYTYMNRKPQSEESFAANWVKKVNETNLPQRFVLEDGSVLELSGGTTVYYPPHFLSDKRELKIEGSAYFKIAKDSSRPFYIHAQELITRVLGTSFWVIYDKANKQSAVEVVTGKVAVYRQEAGNKNTVQTEGVILKPNEKVIFNKTEEVFITTLVEEPKLVQFDSVETFAERSNFVYDEALLTKVVHDLETEYGISIILGSDEMHNLVFTGNLSTLDYYTKLKTICKSLGAAYETKGNRILIQKK